MVRVNIVGAGLAGLSAAVRLAQMNIPSALISVQASERAQSVMAEGGINAAMNVSGESDTVEEHMEDTLRGGVFLADPEAVRGLTGTAPAIVRELMDLGVPFNMEGEKLIQRRFGGQKKTRTAYARSSTGKALMAAMIDAARLYENMSAEIPVSKGEEGSCQADPGRSEKAPLILRFPHHRFLDLCLEKGSGRCVGLRIADRCTGEIFRLTGPVILAFGGPNGLLPGRTTGTTANDACALATVFSQGLELANLEFIQYHPTTVQIPGKRMLVSEAARGEGGRLYVMRGGSKWYFMEEKYPELGNLMPRDVVSREIHAVLHDPSCEPQVYLDLTELPDKVWKKKLPDMRREIIHYLAIDPAKKPVPISPGVHFFMGGILTDRSHRTSVPGLYAAGECACQYHGANRLGANSLLGAIYGGKTAAQTAAAELTLFGAKQEEGSGLLRKESGQTEPMRSPYSPGTAAQLGEVISEGMGIVRDADTIRSALEKVQNLYDRVTAAGGGSGRERADAVREMDGRRIRLGEAVLRCALAREETRGAHVRLDFPDRDDENFRKTTVVSMKEGRIRVCFREIPGLQKPVESR